MPDSKAPQTGKFVAVGHIHTPFRRVEDCPIQGTANDVRGTVVVLPPYADGLKDLDGFDRVWLVYWAQSGSSGQMLVVPRLDNITRGIFATRSLLRPNPIGMACVRLLRVDPATATLVVEGVDMLDGTVLLDIKPYVPRYDAYPDAWAGWLENRVPHERAWQHIRPQAP